MALRAFKGKTRNLQLETEGQRKTKRARKTRGRNENSYREQRRSRVFSPDYSTPRSGSIALLAESYDPFVFALRKVSQRQRYYY